MKAKSSKLIKYVGVVVIAVSALYLIKRQDHVVNAPVVKNETKYQMSYAFSLQNTTPVAAKNIEARAFLSASTIPAQLLLNIQSSSGLKVVEDGMGNQFALFKADGLEAGKNVQVSMQVDLANPITPQSAEKEQQDKSNMLVGDTVSPASYLINDPLLNIEKDELAGIIESIKKTGSDDVVQDLLAWMKNNSTQKSASQENDKDKAPEKIVQLRGRQTYRSDRRAR